MGELPPIIKYPNSEGIESIINHHASYQPLQNHSIITSILDRCRSLGDNDDDDNNDRCYRSRAQLWMSDSNVSHCLCLTARMDDE
jgi:hypothetical protein